MPAVVPPPAITRRATAEHSLLDPEILKARVRPVGRVEALPGQRQVELADILEAENFLWLRFNVRGGARARVDEVSWEHGPIESYTTELANKGKDLLVVVQLPKARTTKRTRVTLRLDDGPRKINGLSRWGFAEFSGDEYRVRTKVVHWLRNPNAVVLGDYFKEVYRNKVMTLKDWEPSSWFSGGQWMLDECSTRIFSADLTISAAEDDIFVDEDRMRLYTSSIFDDVRCAELVAANDAGEWGLFLEDKWEEIGGARVPPAPLWDWSISRKIHLRLR